MPKIDWAKMPKEKLERAFANASMKARKDQRYKAVVHQIIDAMEAQGFTLTSPDPIKSPVEKSKDERSKFSSITCPVHNVMVKKAGTGYKCPLYDSTCEWKLGRFHNPTGSYWEKNKDKLDPSGKYKDIKIEEVPKVEIDGREYNKLKKHLLSRCPLHRKKVVKAEKRNLDTFNLEGYYWKCPLISTCGYGVTYNTHKPFGKAYDLLVKGYGNTVDDLPVPQGSSLFPHEVSMMLKNRLKSGNNKFTGKFAEKLAKDHNVDVPKVIRYLYRNGFDMAEKAGE